MKNAAELPKIQTVQPLASGALRVRGHAAVWAGLDRTAENFTRRAFFAGDGFSAGIERSMNRKSGLPFMWHHKHDHALGSVEDIREDNVGLMMEAVVNYQEPTSPLRFAYDAILNGSARGLSVGGFFSRQNGMIVGADLTEISATPVPVHPGTYLRVVEVGTDPVGDALAAAKLAQLRAEVFLMTR